jgi:hypothetical protein
VPDSVTGIAKALAMEAVSASHTAVGLKFMGFLLDLTANPFATPVNK